MTVLRHYCAAAVILAAYACSAALAVRGGVPTDSHAGVEYASADAIGLVAAVHDCDAIAGRGVGVTDAVYQTMTGAAEQPELRGVNNDGLQTPPWRIAAQPFKARRVSSATPKETL